MLPITKVLNRYHDKKRRIDYEKITKIIKKEQRRRRNEKKASGEPLEEDSEIALLQKHTAIFANDYRINLQ